MIAKQIDIAYMFELERISTCKFNKMESVQQNTPLISAIPEHTDQRKRGQVVEGHKLLRNANRTYQLEILSAIILKGELILFAKHENVIANSPEGLLAI